MNVHRDLCILADDLYHQYSVESIALFIQQLASYYEDDEVAYIMRALNMARRRAYDTPLDNVSGPGQGNSVYPGIVRPGGNV